MALVNMSPGLEGLDGIGSFLKKAGKVASIVFPVAYVANYAIGKAVSKAAGGGAPPPPPPALGPPPPPPPPYPSTLAPTSYPSGLDVQALQAGQYLTPGGQSIVIPDTGTPSWLVPAIAGGAGLMVVLIVLTRKKAA